MTVWIKQGVLGDLGPHMTKAKGALITYYESLGKDFFITSVRDGNHMAGSYHYEGGAMDFLHQDVSKEALAGVLAPLAERYQGRYDIAMYQRHAHVEYDPI